MGEAGGKSEQFFRLSAYGRLRSFRRDWQTALALVGDCKMHHVCMRVCVRALVISPKLIQLHIFFL